MKLSIIIPVYNVAPYLHECLDSVLAQTFAGWEAICIDDGSPDESGVILDEYARRDSRIRVIHKANGGVSSARNAGIEAAKGEWLLFVDGDDLLRQDALEVLVEKISEYSDVDLVRFGYKEFDNGNAVGDMAAGKISAKVIDISKQISFKDVFAYMWQFAYRRSMIGDHRFDLSYHRMEDRPFICRCLMFKCDKFLLVDADLYGYRQRAGSAMHRQTSTITWSGEIRYRIQLMDWADKCGREIKGFARSDWMSGFFMGNHIAGICNRPEKDRKELYAEWFVALKFLSGRTDLSNKQKYFFKLAAIFPCRFWSDVLFLYWPRFHAKVAIRTRLRGLRKILFHK